MTKMLKKVQLSTEQSSPKSVDPTKGTQTNPYTQVEMAKLQEEGTWNGGYIEGMGYVVPMMMDEYDSDSCGSGINPYPQITKDFNHLALSFDLMENVGIQATFVCHCAFSIKGYIMTVSVDILPPHVISSREYYANIEVKDGNNTPTSYKLSRHGEYITPPGHYVIGDCSFELPKSGNAIVTLYVGFIYNSGIGFSGCSGHVQLLPCNE